MSVYAEVAGFIKYTSEPALHDALVVLNKGQWIDGDDLESSKFITDGGHGVGSPVNEFSVTDGDLTLVIPHGNFRNLHRIFAKLLKDADEAEVCFGSNDGRLEMTVISKEPGETANYKSISKLLTKDEPLVQKLRSGIALTNEESIDYSQIMNEIIASEVSKYAVNDMAIELSSPQP